MKKDPVFKKYFLIALAIIIIGSANSIAQHSQNNPSTHNINNSALLHEVIIKTDTTPYNSHQYYLDYNAEKYFFFKATDNDEIAEITIYPSTDHIDSLYLIPSADFSIIDSLNFINKKFFRAKIQFHDLFKAKFLRLVLKEVGHGKSNIEEIKLFPFFETSVLPNQEVTEVFAGEELSIDLHAVNVENIDISQDWKKKDDIEYKITLAGKNLKLQIRPQNVGERELLLSFKTIKPFLDKDFKITYNLKPISIKFVVKPSRLSFINFDRTEYFFDYTSRSNEEIHFEYNRNLALKRTYRIEDKAEGGKLIGELYTQSILDNKMIAWLRLYSLHRPSEGYLYIKDGEETKFLTNFTVYENPKIEKFSVLREGEDWNPSLTVYPGEKLEIRVEGSGLLKSSFRFEDCPPAVLDTSRISDQVLFYFLKIPVNVKKRKLAIYMNNKVSRYELFVKEHQIAKDFDFVSIKYGDKSININDSKFNRPLLYQGILKDLSIVFMPELLDQGKKIYGKQYLSVELKLLNSRGDLIEIQKIDNIVICPDENSPRYKFYDLKDCKKNILVVNDYLAHKTHDIEGWGKLEITVRHNDSRYANPGYSRTITLQKQINLSFDLQIAFPAGLFYKNLKSHSPAGNLTGISTSVLGQLTFYNANKVGQVQPYKIGIGFIALDALGTKDLGLIFMGSLYPIRKNSRLTFPINAGFGYLINKSNFFVVFGPGIQYSF